MRRPSPAAVVSGCGICGIIFIVLGIILFGIIHTKLKEGVDSVRVIPYKGEPSTLKGKKAENFNKFLAKWIGEDTDGTPERVQRLTPRSLTNLAQLQRVSQPDLTTELTFATAKSYNFHTHYYKADIEFHNDGDEVSYGSYKWQEPFDTATTLQEKHWTVNPLYAVAVYTAGSESNLGRGMVLPNGIRALASASVATLYPAANATEKETRTNALIQAMWGYLLSGVDGTNGVLASDTTMRTITAFRGSKPLPVALALRLGTLLTPTLQGGRYAFPATTLPGLLTLAASYSVYNASSETAWLNLVYTAGTNLGLLNATSPKDGTMFLAQPVLADLAKRPDPANTPPELLPISTILRIMDTTAKLMITSKYNEWINGPPSPVAPAAPAAPAAPSAPVAPATPSPPTAPNAPAPSPVFPTLPFTTGLFLPRSVRELVEGNGLPDPIAGSAFGGLMGQITKDGALQKYQSVPNQPKITVFTGAKENKEHLGGVIKEWYGIPQIMYWTATNFPGAAGTGWQGLNMTSFDKAFTRETGVWGGFESIKKPPQNLYSWKGDIWANISLKLTKTEAEIVRPQLGVGEAETNYYEFDPVPMRAYHPPNRVPIGLHYTGGIMHPDVQHPSRATPTHTTIGLADCVGCSTEAKRRIHNSTYASNARPPWANVEPLIGIVMRSSGGFEIMTEIDFTIFDWTVPNAEMRKALATVYVPLAKLEEDVELPEKAYKSVADAHKADKARFTILIIFEVIAGVCFIIAGLYYFLEKRRLRLLEEGSKTRVGKNNKVATEIQVTSGKYTESGDV